MILLFILCVFVTFYNVYVFRWARSELESHLTSFHKDFMHSIEVKELEGIDTPLGMEQFKASGYVIQIDGDIRPYESLFSDYDTLKSLNDLEILRLAKKYQKNKRFCEYSWIIVLLLILVALYI